MGYGDHMTELKTLEVDGTKVKIFVTDKGNFQAQLDGVWVPAGSLKALTEKIKTHVRNTRNIAVQVTMLDDYGPADDRVKIQMLTLTGIHGRGRVIARDDEDGESRQLSQFYGTCVRRLTDPEIKEFLILVRAQWAAYQAVNDWIDAHDVNPEALIREAAEALDPARDAQTEASE